MEMAQKNVEQIIFYLRARSHPEVARGRVGVAVITANIVGVL